MTLQQMRYFIAVAQNLSFSKAAQQHYVSQTAVSQQIKLLEEELEKWLDPDRGIGYIEEAPVTTKKNSNRNYDELNLLNNFFG